MFSCIFNACSSFCSLQIYTSLHFFAYIFKKLVVRLPIFCVFRLFCIELSVTLRFYNICLIIGYIGTKGYFILFSLYINHKHSQMSDYKYKLFAKTWNRVIKSMLLKHSFKFLKSISFIKENNEKFS